MVGLMVAAKLTFWVGDCCPCQELVNSHLANLQHSPAMQSLDITVYLFKDFMKAMTACIEYGTPVSN
jgi:hypothetical protein